MDALPQTIQDATHASLVEKHFQLGHNACGKILDAFLNDLASNEARYAVLLVDLGVHVADMLKAAVNGAFGRPITCIGLCNAQEQLDFVKSEIVHFMKCKLLQDGGFQIPGYTIPDKIPPTDAVCLPSPKLQALVWQGNAIKIKDNDMEKLKKSDNFQDAFDEMVKAVEIANEDLHPRAMSSLKQMEM